MSIYKSRLVLFNHSAMAHCCAANGLNLEEGHIRVGPRGDVNLWLVVWYALPIFPKLMVCLDQLRGFSVCHEVGTPKVENDYFVVSGPANVF